MAKRVRGEDGKMYKVKKPFYKKVWFWFVAVILLIIIGGALGGNKDDSAKNSKTNADSKSETTNQSSEVATSEAPAEQNVQPLLDKYNSIVIGENGSTQDAVIGTFGDPDSTSETTISGIQTVMNIWTGLEGGDLLSALTVSFTDGVANSKSITGLPVDKSNKISLEMYNSIPTDGSYTLEQAEQDFGQPNGYSESNIMGMVTNMVSWSTNADGDWGANFNVTFQDGVAVSKAQGGLQ